MNLYKRQGDKSAAHVRVVAAKYRPDPVDNPRLQRNLGTLVAARVPEGATGLYENIAIPLGDAVRVSGINADYANFHTKNGVYREKDLRRDATLTDMRIFTGERIALAVRVIGGPERFQMSSYVPRHYRRDGYIFTTREKIRATFGWRDISLNHGLKVIDALHEEAQRYSDFLEWNAWKVEVQVHDENVNGWRVEQSIRGIYDTPQQRYIAGLVRECAERASDKHVVAVDVLIENLMGELIYEYTLVGDNLDEMMGDGTR